MQTYPYETDAVAASLRVLLLDALAILIKAPPLAVELLLLFPLLFLGLSLLAAQITGSKPLFSCSVLLGLVGVLKHASVHLATFGAAIERRGKSTIGRTCCEF